MSGFLSKARMEIIKNKGSVLFSKWSILVHQ